MSPKVVAGGGEGIESGIAVVGAQQLGDGGPGGLVAVGAQPGLALGRRPLPHFLEQRGDPGPQTGGHGANSPSEMLVAQHGRTQ